MPQKQQRMVQDGCTQPETPENKPASLCLKPLRESSTFSNADKLQPIMAYFKQDQNKQKIRTKKRTGSTLRIVFLHSGAPGSSWALRKLGSSSSQAFRSANHLVPFAKTPQVHSQNRFKTQVRARFMPKTPIDPGTMANMKTGTVGQGVRYSRNDKTDSLGTGPSDPMDVPRIGSQVGNAPNTWTTTQVDGSGDLLRIFSRGALLWAFLFVCRVCCPEKYAYSINHPLA